MNLLNKQTNKQTNKHFKSAVVNNLNWLFCIPYTFRPYTINSKTFRIFSELRMNSEAREYLKRHIQVKLERSPNTKLGQMRHWILGA